MASLAGLFLVGGFFVVFAWKLLMGEIRLNYLLYGDRRDRSGGGYTKSFSPGRVQLLMVSTLTAGYYILQVIHDSAKFPEIPTAWIVALGGSQAIYLGGKAQSMLFGIRDIIDRRET